MPLPAADEPILLAPVLKPRIWGGERLRGIFSGVSTLDSQLSTSTPIGEAWLTSDRADTSSCVSSGTYRGLTLGERIAIDPTAIYGEMPPPSRFPLLVKWIEARDVLSVQVHPSFEEARALGDAGKMEAWVVIDAAPGARLVRGFRAGTPRDGIESAIDAGTLERLLKWVDVVTGDVIFVAPGIVHAIGAGLVLLEVQNNSDTTYRFFDWNRVDANGKPRALHIDKGLAVMRAGDASPAKVLPTPISEPWPGERLVACEAFTLDRFNLRGSLAGVERPLVSVIAVIEGDATFSSRHGDIPLRAGSTLIVPARQSAFTLTGAAVFCVVTPSRPPGVS
jgi:mannose-6-phosphate isomerase